MTLVGKDIYEDNKKISLIFHQEIENHYNCL